MKQMKSYLTKNGWNKDLDKSFENAKGALSIAVPFYNILTTARILSNYQKSNKVSTTVAAVQHIVVGGAMLIMSAEVTAKMFENAKTLVEIASQYVK